MVHGIQWDDLTAEERLVAEQAVLNMRVLNKVCDEAADGTMLGIAEQLAMKQGRELIRTTLETTLSRQAAAVEKKGRRLGRARAADGEPTADANRERS